ncbi:sulfatase-like hydrolase/transferase [Mariniflexile sp. AS56]|uniref:sulfatase-like hydrolase/transferase n=1 Tax=Mariniflexile sp. AS56 TaxID=3063957 RepID=UPI0026ECF926|nr:sulfatase-like hydrolase/transferase [Mariniflexile sp. AS56]MDO7171700.1 sulfatase-like hydrolase/transferase [Mariniflexile sp. AS56]
MKQSQTPLKLSSLCICLFTVLLSSFGMYAQSNKLPNIIYLMTDDQRWDNMGCYGKPEFKTHNIDQLAEEGVIFDNAFYAVSICMPSRVSIMTGRYISSHRVGFAPPNNHTLSKADFTNSYPSKLKEAGYRTGFVGKIGFAVTEDALPPSSPDNYDMQQHYADAFDFFVGDGTHIGGGLKIWPADDAALKNIYHADRPANERTLKTGDAMLRFIDTQPKDQPFCLSVSFLAVKHDRDSDVYPPHLELFKDYKFPVPANWVNGANHKLPKVVKENWRGVPLHLKRSSTPAMYQRLVRRFAAQGYTVDQQVGHLMKKLKETGLLDNTIIIYTSDNGRFQGSQGLFDKALLYEESVKQPLIVFDGRAAASERKRREKALISSVDIAPTILSLAGLEPAPSMQGHDFSGILNKTQALSSWQDAVYMENLFLVSMYQVRNAKNVEALNEKEVAENKSYRCRGVRTDRWKYFVYYEHNPKLEELYDLDTDPNEQHNLAANPEFADVLTGLRARTEAFYLKAIE